MRYLEWSGSYKQEVEWWLPGAGGGGRGMASGAVSVQERERVLWMGTAGGRAAVWMGSVPLNWLYTEKWLR